MKTTYTKLKSGDWGLRVEGQVREGQTVTVTTKDGKTKQERVGKVLWHNDEVTLCSIARSGKGQCLCDEQGCCRPRCQCERHCVCRGGNVFDCLG